VTASIGIEAIPGHPDFRALSDLPGIRHALRYATADNFVGRDLYTPYDCAWLHRDGAESVLRAAAHLQVRAPGVSLLILDALRPQRVQERMWAALEGTGLQVYLANPQRGSIHSFGMAVDVTLCDGDGRELDMGTPFDDLSERSHPVLEEELLERGELTATAIANRRVLREAMSAAGFLGISREWWHFDAGDRERIRASYQRVL
jgi:D-alanyl-D-alanine dipeptidase